MLNIQSLGKNKFRKQISLGMVIKYFSMQKVGEDYQLLILTPTIMSNPLIERNEDNFKPNKKFMAKFIGFKDGDGYINIGEQKQYHRKTKEQVRSTIRQRFATNLHERDQNLLKYFKSELGIGTIDKKGTNQYRYSIYKNDFIQYIIPWKKYYQIDFLTTNRRRQLLFLEYIISNKYTYWDEINYVGAALTPTNNKKADEIIKKYYISNWIVGFTMAEGSFGFKNNGSAFYSIRQGGIANYEIIKAICIIIALRESRPIKPDTGTSYKQSLTSKKDVNEVLRFFSLSEHHPLLAYKLDKYDLWISTLRQSKRYSELTNLKFIQPSADVVLGYRNARNG